ncbi:sigma-70 family RNA polymerase sigma factor [Candidatus Poribacteria bacterium]|nr:sigma-70 family RNA polymerase sigma factor [Candidatus Poribacteria bacterium]
MKNDDVQLIQRVLEGDDDAFSVLVRKYQKLVLALVWRKFGDLHTAVEITLDTVLNAYKKLPTLKEPQRFDSWLYVIAANRCSSWLRKKRVWTQPLEKLEETDNTHVQTGTYSGYVAAENERTTAEAQRDVVKKLLARLQESERTVITLHYFGEMSCTEIGTFLGVSTNTIKSRLRRAQQRLKKEEPMIREALDNFKITPNLTDNIMQEVARIKPAAPSGGKPFAPWTIAASTIAVVLLMFGFGNQQHALRFQQPYSFEAASEMTVELIETPLVLNHISKPDTRTQIGDTKTPGRSRKSEQPPDDAPAFVAEAHADALVDDYTKWELPKEAKARFGKGGINAIQFSPDGTQIAVGSNIGVWLYDAETGKEINMFPGMCQAIAFSPDGQFIASSSGKFGFHGEGLQLWETATGQKAALIDGPPAASALHFSEDRKTLLSLGNWGELISQLDIETKQANVKNIDDRSFEKMPRRYSPEPYALTADKFAVGGQNGKIQLWDTMTRKKLATLNGHTAGSQEQIQEQLLFAADEETPPEEDQVRFVDGNPFNVLTLAFSPDGTRLASGGKDKTVRLWDTATNNELATLQKHTGWTNALAFSPDGKMLASGSTDKTVQLWDTATGAHLATLTGHANNIVALAFSPNGRTLASGSIDGTIRFWNTETGDLLPLNIMEHTEWVKAVSFFKDSSTLASVAFNGVITFWDLKTSQKTGGQTIDPWDFLMTSAFSPDGTKLVSTGAKFATFLNIGPNKIAPTWEPDRLVRLTDVHTGHELATLTKTVGGLGGVQQKGGMTFSPDGKMVAFYGVGKIHVWHTERGDTFTIPLVESLNDAMDHFLSDAEFHQHTMTRLLDEVRVLMFSPDGKKLVSGTGGGKVQMWDAETGTALAPFLAGQDLPSTFTVALKDPITALSFSSNGTLLAVGSEEKIRLLGNSKQPRLKDVPRGTQSLVFSPDDTVLVTGLRNGGIELWDLATGEKITTLNGHTQPVETLVFSPDAKTLVSTGQDGTILVWDWEEAVK